MFIVAILRLHLTKTHEKANVDTLGVETTSPSNHVESVLEKQKEIEAENRKKKEAIKKALDDR